MSSPGPPPLLKHTLLGLLWIFFMLHLAWPSPCPATNPASPSYHGAHAPASRKRLPVSPTNPSVSRVSRHRQPPRSLPLLRHRHGSPPPVAASARWTPGTMSART